MNTNENVKQIIKDVYTPSEFRKEIFYIEPEQFDINKLKPILKIKNNWAKVMLLYEYPDSVTRKLLFKTNYSKIDCRMNNNRFDHFALDINSNENANLKCALHKIDKTSMNFVLQDPHKLTNGIMNNMLISFASLINGHNVMPLLDQHDKFIKCRTIQKLGKNETIIIKYNSRSQIQKFKEKGQECALYDEYSDIQSPPFIKMIKSVTMRDNYGGYEAKYIVSPEINIGPLEFKNDNVIPKGYYSSFKTYQVEIKHTKSMVKSIIDEKEIIILDKNLKPVEI